jgi:hypothetical protein
MFYHFLLNIYKMKKNNINNKGENILSDFLLSEIFEKSSPGIHPDMIIDVFKAENIRKGMTISGVYISDIIEDMSSEFVVIKKNSFYKNVPNKDTILSPGQKIRVNDKDKRVESLIDNNNIYRLLLPDTQIYNFLSYKKEYLYLNNIQVVCGNDKKYNEDNKNDEISFL